MRILVVEDERQIAELVEQLLVDYNYAVDIATDGEAGLAMAAAYAYDSIVLDIGLPKLDGIEVCKQLRSRHYRNPILLLTGRSGSENKAIALNAGADDYVVKPFDPIELIARVQALLRRPANGERPILSWGNLIFDPNTRQVSYGERLLILTPKEYAILELLLRNPRSPLSSKAILERVWTADEFPAEEVVRGHIKELRHKLTAADAPKDLIKTAYGVGYRLNPLYAAVGAEPIGIPQVAELAAVNEELRTTLDRLRTTQDILRASEERYRLFSEASPVGIFRNGVDGHCTYVNEKTAQLLGVPPAECLGLNWLETLHPDDRQWVYEGWCDFVARSAGGETATYSFECRHVHSDGTIVWVLVNIVPERDAAGAMAGYIGTLTDISARKHAEAGLRASEAKYRTLFESIEEGFVIIELLEPEAGAAIDYRILEINQAYERQSGLTNVVGKLGSEIAPQTESYWLEAYANVVRTGEPQQLENYHQDTQRWYLAHASRVGNGDSRQVAIVFEDITARKRQERDRSILAEITHELARLNSIEETMNRLGETIGRYFGVTHCVFTELSEDCELANAEYAWNEAGFPSLKATYRTREFLSDAQFATNMAGEMTIVNDTRTDPRISAESYGALGILSFVIVPLVRNDRWQFMLSIIDRQPRAWRDDEVTLMQEIANRIWTRLERARAEATLRESAAKYRTLFDSIDEGFCLLEVLFDQNETAYDYRFLEVNGAFAAQSGLVDAAGKTILELVPNLEPQWADRYGRVAKSGNPLRFEADVPSMNRVFDIYAFPTSASGKNVVAVLFTDITDRKRAEINTQTSLEIALEAAQMGTWYLDVERDVAVRSLRHDLIFGFDTLQPEWGREIARQHILPADLEGYDAAFERAMTTGMLDFEVRVLWPDGSIHWMAAWGRFEFDRHGHVTSGYGVNLDITERKQAEAELQTQQRLLEQVTESTTAILYIHDPIDCRTLYVNARVETILGYTPAAIQAMGRNQIDLVHPDDKPALLAAFDRCAAAADGEIVEYEYRMRDLNGNWHWLQSRDRVLERAADGTVTQKIGTAIDITARKQAENTIAEQAALLDIATDAIFVRCLENRILYWNQGAERMYGWTAAEAIGHTATELLREPADRIAKIMQTMLARGEWQGELQKFCKSGRELTVEGRWTLVRDEIGQPKSILCVNTDITEKKQLQAQFYQAQRLESLGTLASGIAHDLNNVLTPVLAFAQILRRQSGMDRKSQERLQIIEDNARRGADMVSQILTFARGTIGKRIPLQVNHLLRDVVKVAQQTFPKSIVILTGSANDLVGEAYAPRNRHLPIALWLVAGDATQLHQVFLNLCVNARDAMPQGGRLRITAENHPVDELFARLNLNARAGNYILVTITDTGMGIPPEILDRIFDPFFTTKPIGEGTGLGLSTVLGIVTNHGGFVRVTSTVGEGTEFKIYLPAIEGEEQAIDTDTASELPRGNGELILIVDDDSAVREANRSLLEEYNYQTLIATDGIEAMALYAQQMQAIDLVLIDAMMPNASGTTAIRTIRRMNPQVKILAISGLSSNQDSLLEAGASEFLAKPYQLTDLLQTIAGLLND